MSSLTAELKATLEAEGMDIPNDVEVGNDFRVVRMIDGVARVDTSRCLGCGVCAKACPKGMIYMVPQDASVAVMCNSKDKGADARKACVNACIGCKKCEKTCPHEAIHVADNLAFIMYSKCTGCGQCVADCPTGCLKEVFFPDLPEGTVAEDLLD